MKKLRLHFLVALRSQIREPAYVVSTLVFPSLFFLFFAQPNADTPEKAKALLASFSAYAVLSVMFLDFSVSTARDRQSAWASYVRTLDRSFFISIVAKCLNAMLFSLLAVLLVFATVHASTDIQLQALQGLKLILVLLIGAPIFGLIGFALGMNLSKSSALPVTNLIYLTMTFAGGLWIPPNGLSTAVQKISPYLPSRAYGEVLWSTVLEQSLDSKWIFALLGFGLLAMISIALKANRT